jgi:hypothetical protein
MAVWGLCCKGEKQREERTMRGKTLKIQTNFLVCSLESIDNWGGLIPLGAEGCGCLLSMNSVEFSQSSYLSHLFARPQSGPRDVNLDSYVRDGSVPRSLMSLLGVQWSEEALSPFSPGFQIMKRGPQDGVTCFQSHSWTHYQGHLCHCHCHCHECHCYLWSTFWHMLHI